MAFPCPAADSLAPMDYFLSFDVSLIIPKNIIKAYGETTTHFIFDHIITQFGISKDLVTDHGRHFQNNMMAELCLNLGYKQEHSSSYYPQANG